MTERVGFRCNNCGHRFETEVLDGDACGEARRENRPTNAVHSPECYHTDIQRGWDRPIAAVQSLADRRGAASPDQPFVHRAAFSEDESR